MNSNGSAEVGLATNMSGVDYFDPDWSPDGQRIAFTSAEPDDGTRSAEISTPMAVDGLQ